MSWRKLFVPLLKTDGSSIPCEQKVNRSLGVERFRLAAAIRKGGLAEGENGRSVSLSFLLARRQLFEGASTPSLL